MKHWVLMGLMMWAGGEITPAMEPPRGRLIELHSCELYTGGCIASSEVTLKGHYSLTAWQFENAEWKGLSLAILQASPQNLAVAAAPSDAVVYFSARANERQREALIGWVRQQVPLARILETRAVPMEWSGEGIKTVFRAGREIQLTSGALLPCGLGSCGESLWYRPRVDTQLFGVGLTKESQIAEPALQLKWNELNQRNIFVANFDQARPAAARYTACEDLCSHLPLVKN